MIHKKIGILIVVYFTGAKLFPFCQENYKNQKSRLPLHQVYTFFYRRYVRITQLFCFSVDLWLITSKVDCSETFFFMLSLHFILFCYMVGQSIWMVPQIEQANLTRQILYWDRKLYGEDCVKYNTTIQHLST